MSYSTIKWTIFVALFLTVPAMLFLVQAVIFFPLLIALNTALSLFTTPCDV